MMSDETALRPCPNPECGSTELELIRIMQVAATNRQYVRCRKCAIHGPLGSGEREGRRLWDALPRADDAKAGPATLAMLDLSAQPLDDEDNDYMALTDESWAIVHAFRMEHGRNPFDDLDQLEVPRG